MNKLLTVLCFAILNIFSRMFMLYFEMFCTYLLPSNRRTCSETQEQSNYCSRTFWVCFRTNSRMFMTFVMFRQYSPRLPVLRSLTYRWEVLMSVQVENFENSHIQGSRAFAYMFAQFSRMVAILQCRYWYSLPSKNFAASHTNKSSSSVETH